MNRINYLDLCFRWVAPLVVLSIGVGFVYMMGLKEKPNRKKPKPNKSVPVDVVKFQPFTGIIDVAVNGTVIPHREVELSALVAGEIILKSECLSPGHVVSAGEILVKIDPQDYQIEVDRLTQERQIAEIKLTQLAQDRTNTEKLLAVNKQMATLRQADVERMERLRSAASAIELSSLKHALLTTQEKLVTYENQLKNYDAQQLELESSKKLISIQLRRATLDLERTVIKAPFSGVVITNHVEQNANVAKGQMVATLEDTAKVDVRCNLRDQDLAFIYNSNVDEIAKSEIGDPYRLPNTEVTIEYDRAGQVYRWNGILSAPDGLGLDQNTRTMPVRIEVANPTQNQAATSTLNLAQENNIQQRDSIPQPLALVRGMFVRVRIHCQPKHTYQSLPESVIRPGKTLWIAKDGKLKIQRIEIARIENGIAYFNSRQSGVDANAPIISTPVPNAREGLSVSLRSNRNTAQRQKQKGNSADNLASRKGKPE